MDTGEGSSDGEAGRTVYVLWRAALSMRWSQEEEGCETEGGQATYTHDYFDFSSSSSVQAEGP